jgi:hypothetical protein
MNKSHLKTLKAIFSQPTPSALEWRRIESLFVALGAQIIEGSGSRVRFVLNGIIATRGHPLSIEQVPELETMVLLRISLPGVLGLNAWTLNI